MILKIVTFLCKTISTYWYTSNQGIQIHCKQFDKGAVHMEVSWPG